MERIDLNILNTPLPSDDGKAYSLADFAGKRVVLYFYPKDKTSGCTLQAQGYRDLQGEFEALNTVILGVSRDTVRSHCGFIEKENLNFRLLSDKEKLYHTAFDLLKPKKMYGKDVVGVVRSTFIFNEKGELIKALRDVKAEQDPYTVLEFIKSL